jgi:segregation and condensation protein A
VTYQVKLETFEGPLDLLLHLIRENQVDILDIPIALITEQYLGYVKLMEELDLGVAGEFLVMAATLVHLKSRMLLPPEEIAAGEEPPEDPRAELVDRLLEYQRFKEVAGELAAREAEQNLRHTRGGPPLVGEVEGPLSLSLFDLLAAFRRVLARAEGGPVLEITRETLDVGQRLLRILDALNAESPIPFPGLFAGQRTRPEIIVTFLALLEILRRGLASARQPEPFGEIMVYRAIAPATPEVVEAAVREVSASPGS